MQATLATNHHPVGVLRSARPVLAQHSSLRCSRVHRTSCAATTRPAQQQQCSKQQQHPPAAPAASSPKKQQRSHSYDIAAPGLATGPLHSLLQLLLVADTHACAASGPYAAAQLAAPAVHLGPPPSSSKTVLPWGSVLAAALPMPGRARTATAGGISTEAVIEAIAQQEQQQGSSPCIHSVEALGRLQWYPKHLDLWSLAAAAEQPGQLDAGSVMLAVIGKIQQIEGEAVDKAAAEKAAGARTALSSHPITVSTYQA